MTFNEYSDAAIGTATYPLRGINIIYPALGLSGEAGEVTDKIKKLWRNNNYKNLDTYDKFTSAIDAMSAESLTEEDKTQILLELGDVLWYINALTLELGKDLDELARMNLAKLADRKKRDVVCSQGDNR